MVLQLFLAALILAPVAASARQSTGCVVSKISGAAKIQHADGEWAEIAEGMHVVDNDVIETGENGIVSLQIPAVASAVVGIDSKVLVSLGAASGRKAGSRHLTLNVFGGTLWVESQPGCSVTVYTTGAVVEATGNALAVVFDPETNETNVQAIGGDSVGVRSVAERRGRWLSAGRTTVVVPGAGSSAPRPFSEGHVTVLQHYLGEEFVTDRIEHYELLPKPADAGGLEALTGGSEVALSPQRRASAKPTSYPRLFTANRVWGKILEDEERRRWFYHPVSPRRPLFDSTFSVGLSGGAAINGDGAQWLLALTPSIQWRFIDAGLSIEFGENHAGWTMAQFRDGVEGAFDIVDHLRVGYPEDSLFVGLERLDDYTVGNGLVIRHLDTRPAYSLYQPLGLNGMAALFDMLYIQGFVSDISDFAMAGLRTEVRVGGFTGAVGYYRIDAETLLDQAPRMGNRFVTEMVDSTPALDVDPAHVAELSLGADLFQGDAFVVGITGGVAYHLESIGDNRHRYRVEGPTAVVDIPRVRLGFGYLTELSRWRPVPSIRRSDRMRGARLFCYVQPVRGLAVEGEITAPLFGWHTAEHFIGDSVVDTTDRFDGSYDYYAAISVNDSLVPFLHSAKLSLMEFGGGTDLGPFNLRARFQLQTQPLVFNTAVECGVEYSAVDFDGDSELDDEDRIIEFSLGLRWGLP